ncbi:MAG TPA: tetratricopeptide repeat protein [Planktothrix sp.]
MVTSAKRAIDLRADLKGKLPYDLQAEDYEKIGIALGVVEGSMDLATVVSEAFQDTWKVMQDAWSAADKVSDEIEPLVDIKREFQSVFGAFANEAGKFINQTFEELMLPAFGLPGRELPDHLPAYEYFDMARKYKTMGWCEQARDALAKVIEVAPDETTRREARRYLATRIPRLPVPHLAVQQNIRGHNQIVRGDLDGARTTLEAIVKKFPEFEWARGNLGLVYAQLGELDKAEEILSSVLDYNPNYLNAWLHLARLKAAKLEVREAQRYLDKALRLDPEDQPAQALKQIIEFLSL